MGKSSPSSSPESSLTEGVFGINPWGKAEGPGRMILVGARGRESGSRIAFGLPGVRRAKVSTNQGVPCLTRK